MHAFVCVCLKHDSRFTITVKNSVFTVRYELQAYISLNADNSI